MIDSVFSLAKTVHIVVQFFGYWPFSLELRKTYRVQFKVLDYIRILLVLLFYSSCIYAEWTLNAASIQENESSIENVFNLASICGEAIIILASILFDVFNRNRIWSIIVMLNKFDRTVSTTASGCLLEILQVNILYSQMELFGHHFNYEQQSRYLHTCIVAAIFAPFCLLTFAYVAIVDSTFPNGIILAAVYALLDSSHMVVAFVFQFLLINVQLRFHLINKILR